METLCIIVVILIVVALPVYYLIFVLKSANKSTNRAAKKVNFVIASAAAALVLFSVFNIISDIMQSKKYDIHDEEVLGGLDYVSTEDGSHILCHSGLLWSEMIRVPDSVRLPLISHIYSPVKAYCEKGTPFPGEERQSDKHPYSMYYSGDNVVKLSPNYFNMIVTLAFIIYVSFSLYNFIMFIIALNERREKKRHEAEINNIIP